VAVYADESCLGNGKAGDTPGGAGGLVEWRHPGSGDLLRWDWWISEPDTTNNRMALRSVIETFAGLSGRGAPSRWCSRATRSTSSTA
jgi:ribonuclease HI